MLFALGAVSSAARSAQDPDVVEIVVGAIRRFDAGYRQSVRPHRRLPGFDRLGAEQRLRRLRSFANLAGDHERTAGRAGPVHDRFELGDQPSDAMKDLFSQIDANGDGKITRSEFEDALGAGRTNLEQADDVFSKLDKDSDGSVSLGEMSSALKGGKGHHHHHVASSAASAIPADRTPIP